MASSWTGRRPDPESITRPRPVRGALTWFHRWIGLTLGLVLAVMGTTGSLMSFRPELQDAFAPRIELAVGERLPLAVLVARLEGEAAPAQVLRMLAWTNGSGAIEARYGGPGVDATWLVDPVTGERLARPWGDAAFWAIERVHRTLALGDAGHWITFAAALALIALVAVGITLRLPWRGESLPRWLSPRSSVPGRPRWRRLHAVAGTWLLPMLLCSALTGLFWASDAYRNALLGLAGEPGRPPRPAVPQPSVRPLPDLSRALTTFAAAAPDAARVMFPIPRDATSGVEFRYLAAAAPHERAFGTARISVDGSLVAHEPFAGQPRGRRAIALVYPLHTGSWFGITGRVLQATGATALPLLFGVGLYLTLGRRRRALPASGIVQRQVP